MIKMSKKIAAGILMICLLATAVSAAAADSGGFSVKAVIPDNQIDTRQSYFDLRMQPGQQQTLEIIITNSRDEELTAQLALNHAVTGRNGLIVYSESDNSGSSAAPYITDIAKLRTESVTVPARGKKTVAVDIKMPDEPIHGVILGGITVTDSGEGDTAQATESVALVNKITYVIAIKLSGDDTETQADFDLAGVKPELINYQPAVVATLENKAARIVKNMAVTAQVMRKNSDTVLHEMSRPEAEMAPLSKGAFVIDWENRPVERGTYRLKMTADYEGQTWVWDEEFTVGEEAGIINSGAVGMIRDYTWLYVLFGIVALMLVWFIAYAMGRRRKKEGETRA